ncbi:hypothetical protein PSHT_05569 [Puccinia striiformis]|uniref:Uncharacterized protein n=1 Tax=Puccinia striiformis TaxID=27350 RepID=A0A2S4WAJ4_9BASI|nr:hypothetical protein PSHT_05569 [Puccinia striiformis]
MCPTVVTVNAILLKTPSNICPSKAIFAGRSGLIILLSIALPETKKEIIIPSDISNGQRTHTNAKTAQKLNKVERGAYSTSSVQDISRNHLLLRSHQSI